MNDFIVPVLAWLVTYAIHSTLLLCGVAILTTLFIERVAWRETLWKVALVGGVITATAQSAVGISPLGGRWDIARATGAAIAPERRLADEPPAGNEATGRVAAAIEPALGPTPGVTWWERDRRGAWPPLLVGAWALTALALLAVLANRQRTLHGLLRDRRQVRDPELLAMLGELRIKARVRRHVWLSVSSRCSTPLAIGLSEICVPRHLFAELAPEEKRSALGHELAHLVRRDTLWELAAGAVIAVLFFQPLNHLARRRLREAAEELCDDWVVRETGSALGMARCLSRVASWLATAPEPVPAGTLAMAEGGSLLLRRVARLTSDDVDRSLPRARTRRVAVGAVLVVTTGIAPMVGTGPTGPWLSLQVVDQTVRGQQEQASGGAQEAALMVVIRSDAPLDGREEAVEALGRLRSAEAVQLLVDIAFGGFDRALQEEAVGAIGAAGRAEDVDVLARIATAHPDRHVREEAVETLGDRATPGAVAVLRGLLESETEVDVRKEAVEELAEMPYAEVPGILLRVAMNDRDLELQEQAVEALAQFPPADVAPLLRRIVWEHEVSATRQQAAEASGELPAQVALPILDEIVDAHSDPDVVVEAVDAIGAYAGEESLVRLTRIAEAHPRAAARREALDELRDRVR